MRGFLIDTKYFNINNRDIYQQMKELISTEFFHTLQEASQKGLQKTDEVFCF